MQAKVFYMSANPGERPGDQPRGSDGEVVYDGAARAPLANAPQTSAPQTRK